jgi:hypothetical protein
MRLLILESALHHKNKQGLYMMLNELKWDYKYGSISDINDYDIIYSPSAPLDASQYPDKKFIFGPHFSVFPDNRLINVNNTNNNAIYIQPSVWVYNLWRNMGAERHIEVKTQPFPPDTSRFSPVKDKKRDKVFIYYKRRNPDELTTIKTFLNNKHIEYKIFDYVKRYDEKYYLEYLQESKYGIVLDAHESQGFAIEEALSCDVPLLVWNTRTMNQEHGSQYQAFPCSTIPYWDERCGEFFYEEHEFEKAFNVFIDRIDTYKPRQYILENLSVSKCADNLQRCIIEL